MTPGVTVDHTDPNISGITGTSDLSGVFGQVGGNTAALTMIQNAFNAWSGVANISFVQVTETGAVPFAAAYSDVGANVIGDIRIGGFNINGFSAAVGFAAPPNGGRTLEFAGLSCLGGRHLVAEHGVARRKRSVRQAALFSVRISE